MEIKDFLLESALLSQGLVSISAEEMERLWPPEFDNIAWLEKGQVKIGGMKKFLPFRAQKESRRIDYYHFEEAKAQGLSGALTASGTMRLAEELGIKLVVTCGIGGIGDIQGEEFCPDLPALAESPCSLLATSPKDLVNIEASLNWLRDHQVALIGINSRVCNGYLLKGENFRLDKSWDPRSQEPRPQQGLFLNSIPESKRLADKHLLLEAFTAGKEAELKCLAFHPAANAYFDQATHGYSSRIQLESLIANARLARLYF